MLRLEFRVVHAMLVVSDVVGAFACLLATCRVSPESLADGRQPAGIQFLVPLLGPLAGSFRMVRIEGLGDVTQVLLDMEAVDDFHGSRAHVLAEVRGTGSREGRRRGRVPYAAARRGRSRLPAPRRFAPLAWPAPRPRPIRGAVGCPLRSSLEQRPWPPCG